MTLHRHALSWMRDHHATIPTTQDAGPLLPTSRRRRLVESGELRRVVDGGDVFGALEDHELVRCTAICTSRAELVVGGPTAARLWRFRRAPRDGVVHVVAPPASHPCRAPWLLAHRTSTLAEQDVVERLDGIRLTSCSRTMVDMTRYLGPSDLASMLEDVLARGVCTEESLLEVATRLASKGRPWVRRLSSLVVARRPEAPAESEWQRRVCEQLRRRHVSGIETQYCIELPGYGRARFDLAVPAIRWALEVDVHPVDHSMEGAASDNRRDGAAEAAGWVVRRVAELQLRVDLAGTIDELVASIERRRRSFPAPR